MVMFLEEVGPVIGEKRLIIIIASDSPRQKSQYSYSRRSLVVHGLVCVKVDVNGC